MTSIPRHSCRNSVHRRSPTRSVGAGRSSRTARSRRGLLRTTDPASGASSVAGPGGRLREAERMPGPASARSVRPLTMPESLPRLRDQDLVALVLLLQNPLHFLVHFGRREDLFAGHARRYVDAHGQVDDHLLVGEEAAIASGGNHVPDRTLGATVGSDSGLVGSRGVGKHIGSIANAYPQPFITKISSALITVAANPLPHLIRARRWRTGRSTNSLTSADVLTSA